MIAGIFHQGSGLGNQLHRYIATRILALDKGYDFGMIDPHLFKGKSFMKINMGLPVHFQRPLWQEKRIEENGIDIRGYDPEINFVEDGTVIDGEFQDPKYFEHRLGNVNRWLKVEKLPMPDDLCVIGFRGGEFALFPDLFLTVDYWQDAIYRMQRIKPNMRFEVHTDDPILAQKIFPNFPVIHDIGLNWRSVRFAKYLIIANSSFYIFPALLNTNANLIIAPRYWARRNIGVWALPQNYYKQFTYI